MSNVGLGKACRRHDIPVPPRGYWARHAAGQKLPRPPLPPARDGRESVTLWGSDRPDPQPDEPDGAVHPLIAFELKPQNKIGVAVDIPEAIVLPYEWITESRSHRRFSVPAAVVNLHGRVSKEDDD